MNYFGFVRSVSSPVQAVHITVNVPGSCRRQEQIPPEQFRHLRQGETVEAVEAVLCCLLLPEPDKHVTFLFAESPSNTNDFPELGKIMTNFFLRNFSVFIQKAEAEITKDILLNVPVELDQSILWRQVHERKFWKHWRGSVMIDAGLGWDLNVLAWPGQGGRRVGHLVSHTGTTGGLSGAGSLSG